MQAQAPSCSRTPAPNPAPRAARLTAGVLLPARLMLGTLVVALAAAVSQTAVAQPADGPRHGGMHAMEREGMRGGMHGGMHGDKHGAMHGGMHGGPGMMMMNPRALQRMLDNVKATPEQRSQIQQIMDAARGDMKTQFDAGRTLREQGQALFAKPTIDAREAEALRQQMLAQHDQSSKRMLQAMLDVQRVLTPEQRQQIAERIAQRQQMMQRHRAERDAQRSPR